MLGGRKGHRTYCESVSFMEEFEHHIEPYTGELGELLEFFQISRGKASLRVVSDLITIEKTRGTKYYSSIESGKVTGFIGVWFDSEGVNAEFNPAQVIDLAVAPNHRRKGIARALMERVVSEVRKAGYDRLMVYTDERRIGEYNLFRQLGFRLVSVVPDWFDDGSAKSIFQMNIEF